MCALGVCLLLGFVSGWWLRVEFDSYAVSVSDLVIFVSAIVVGPIGGAVTGVGGAIGLVLGVAITLAQQYFGFVKMPNGNFLVENYPVELQTMDLIVIFVVFVAVAFAVSLVATSTMIKRR